MSKFVTYGVTEMLDNDQKFIIDSDRTGPGSITAKDAASSLLSKWAGFETFEEAVQNTISNNQEFIDRDTAIRSETAELKKKIVTTFPAKEASGAVATFESEFEDAPLKSCIVRIEPVQDLHGYDHPWPAGGGKNLFSGEGSALPYQAQGITITEENGVYTIVASGASGYPFATIGVLHGLKAGTYTLSYEKTDTLVTGNSSIRLANRTVRPVATYTNTFTLSEDVEDDLLVELAFTGENLSDGTYTVQKVQLELGSTATSYAPYENICPITGWTGCEVQRTGKNLLDESTVFNSPYNQYFLLDLKYNTDYVFSTDSTITGLYITYSDSETKPNIYTSSDWTDMTFMYNITSLSFNSGTHKWYRLMTYEIDGVTAGRKFQLELGSTATDYEPYSGNTYDITFPTEAGTVYGGTLDVTKGELVVDRAMIVFDGTQTPGANWQTKENSTAWYYNYNLTKHVFPTYLSEKPSFIANRCPIVTTGEIIRGDSSQLLEVSCYNASSSIGIIFRTTDMTLTTESAINNYLADNPVELVYEIASPITYHLAPQEITSLLGTNNIWSNTGDTAVEYLMSDVSWYVEKKLRAFQSILAGVEDSAVASKNYSANTYLIFNNDIYRVTKAITAGETIEEGVNVTKTTVAEQLIALAQA